MILLSDAFAEFDVAKERYEWTIRPDCDVYPGSALIRDNLRSLNRFLLAGATEADIYEMNGGRKRYV